MAALKAGDMNEVLVAYRLIVDSKNILTVARDSREKTIPSIMLATSPPAWDFQEVRGKGVNVVKGVAFCWCIVVC